MRCDRAVAEDAATQADVRQLEQAYDVTGDETLRPRREDDFNPSSSSRTRRLLAPGAGPWRGVTLAPGAPRGGAREGHLTREARTRTDQSSRMEAAWNITRCCRAKGQSCDSHFSARDIKGWRVA